MKTPPVNSRRGMVFTVTGKSRDDSGRTVYQVSPV
jgi:hypothetical protein